MDIEQLKLILDAATAAGTGATKIVLIWFAYKFTWVFVGTGLWGSVIWGTYKLIAKAMSHFGFSSQVARVLSIDIEYCAGRERALKEITRLKHYERTKEQDDAPNGA